MKIINNILRYMAFGAVIFLSCNDGKQPDYQLNEDFSILEDKNGVIIRKVTIEKYDADSNFIGKKYINKDLEKKGGGLIRLFSTNADYYSNGDSLTLEKGYTYKVYIRTLMFADSLVFRP